MTNKKKLDSRSNKRKIKLPNKYNDHVMSSLSQNRANPEPPMNCDEIRVNIGGNQVDCDELEVNKLGDEINKIGDLSERYEEVSDDESDKLADIGSENLGSNLECLDEGFKEIDKEIKDIVNVTKETEIVTETSEMNASAKREADKRNFQRDQVKTYDNVTRKNETVDSNKLKTIPTDINDLGEEVVIV
ncbi:hypothetical protein Tco_0303124 [Tanacetum coccineum]